MSNVKGIREKGKLNEEPTIKVDLANGQSETLKLEEYILGVVAGEMENGWGENAYAAQAILARTFALKYMEEKNTNSISSSFDQAQEYNSEKITDTIKKAVEKTRGVVALHKEDYIKGWFHASAGGQTSSAKVGLAYPEEEPLYIKSVKSPDQDAPEEIKNWNISISFREIEESLKKMGENIGQLKEIKILDKDKAGRVIEFNIKGTGGAATISAANFRKEIGPKKLKSTKIKNIKKEDSSYLFNGSGFGHGVGMSQWGAYSMAKKGKKAEDIVSYYFKDIEIVRVYD